MTPWTSDELTRIGTAEELAITTLRRDGEPTALGRRSFLRGSLAGAAGVVIGAHLRSICTAARPPSGAICPS